MCTVLPPLGVYPTAVKYISYHIISYHINIFLSTGKPYRACQCEVTEASSWLCRKDGSLKCSWIFSGATL